MPPSPSKATLTGDACKAKEGHEVGAPGVLQCTDDVLARRCHSARVVAAEASMPSLNSYLGWLTAFAASCVLYGCTVV